MDSKKTTDITARIKQVASRISGIPPSTSTFNHINSSGTKIPPVSDDLVASSTITTTTTSSPTSSVVKTRLHVTEIPPQEGPSRKTELEKRREEKRREEQAQATFQPKIPSSSIRLDKKTHNQPSDVKDQSDRGRDSTADPSKRNSRFDALYNDARKRRTEGPVLKNNVTDNDLTFKPAIPRRSRSLSKDRNGTWTSNEPKETIAQRLHQTKGTGREKKIETTTAQKEEVFKPTIPKRSSSLARSIGPPVDLQTRFTKAEVRRVEELDQLKAEVDANLLDPCSFVPEITKKAKSLAIPTKDGVWFDKKNVGTAADRLMQYKLDLKAKKEDMRKQHEQKTLADEPFKPTIPLRSKKVAAAAAAQANSGETVHSRLAKPTIRKVTAATAAVEAAMTFQPKASKPISHSPEDCTWRDINVNSNKISMPHREVDKPVHERLHEDAHHKKLQLETERQLAEEQAVKAFPFAPVLPVAPTTILPKSPEGTASSTPIHERLATDNRKFMHSVLSQVHAEMELEPCTFKPNVEDPLQLAEKRAKEGPVLERLKKDEERNRKSIGLKQKEQLAKTLSELKTRPTIPDISVELAHKKRMMPSSSTPLPLSSSSASTSVPTKKLQSTPPSSSMKKLSTPSSDSTKPGATKQSPATDSFHDRLSKTHTQASSPQPNQPSPGELLGSSKKTIVISQEESDAIVERLMASAGKHKEEIRNEIKTQVNERKFAELKKEESNGTSSVSTTPKTPQDKELLKQSPFSSNSHSNYQQGLSGSKMKPSNSIVSSSGSPNPTINVNNTGLGVNYITQKEAEIVNTTASQFMPRKGSDTSATSSFIMTRKGSDVVMMSPPTREIRSISFVKGDIAPDNHSSMSVSPGPDTIPHNLGTHRYHFDWALDILSCNHNTHSPISIAM